MSEPVHLTIDEFERGFNDLLANRLAALLLLSSGAVYKKLVETIRDTLQAIPVALKGLARAELLKLHDVRHDACLRAIHYIRLAMDEWPDPTPETKAAAATIATEFVTELAEARRPYGVEAQRADDLERKLPAHAATLEAVPTPDKGTLKDWVETFIAAGQAIGREHSGRADDKAARIDASGAGAARGRALGIVSDLRTAISRDREANPGLPSSLEADILGYIDELERLALARSAGGEGPPPGGAPT